MDFVKIYCVNKYPVQLLKQQTMIPYVFHTEQQQIPRFIFNPKELVLHPYDQFFMNKGNVVKQWNF